MRNWLAKISSKYTVKVDDGVAPISVVDSKIVEAIIAVLDAKGEDVSDISNILERYKVDTDDTTLHRLTELVEEIESDPEYKPWVSVDINGTTIPIKKINTIKELSKYDFNSGVFKYSIMINEQDDGNLSVYSNINIKCKSEKQMHEHVDSLKRHMNKLRIKFIKI